MEIVTSWQEQGRKEGRKEGAQQTALEIALRLLQRRFGKLNQPLKRHLKALSVTQLTALSEAAFDLQDKAALNDWLTQHAQKTAGK